MNDEYAHTGAPHIYVHLLGGGRAEVVEFLNRMIIYGLCISLSGGQRQFQIHHFIVGLSQLKHQLSADHQVVLGVQVYRRRRKSDLTILVSPYADDDYHTEIQRPNFFQMMEKMEGQNSLSTTADWLQHINSSLVHFAASFQILFKESQRPEQRTVILQDLYMVCHVPIHLEVLLGLQE